MERGFDLQKSEKAIVQHSVEDGGFFGDPTMFAKEGGLMLSNELFQFGVWSLHGLEFVFPNDPQVVALAAEVFFFGDGVHFPLFTQLVLIFLAMGAFVNITSVKFVHGPCVGVVTVHKIGANANFADVIACMENMDPLSFHEIIHPMEHVVTRESRVWLEVRSTSSDIPSAWHGFVDAVEVERIRIESDDIDAGTRGIVPDKSASHLIISGEYDARTPDDVLLDGVVEIVVLRLYQTKVGFGIMCGLE